MARPAATGWISAAVLCLALVHAATADAAGPQLDSVSPQPVAPGQSLTVDGSGFWPSQDVALYWDHRYTTPPAAVATADATGAVRITLLVPPVPDGLYDAEACAYEGACSDAIAAHHDVEVATPVPAPVIAVPPPPSPSAAPIPAPRPRPRAAPPARPSATPTPTAQPAPVPPPPAPPRPPPTRQRTPPQPLYTPAAILDLQVSLFALMAVAAGGGAAVAGARDHARTDAGRIGKVASVKVVHLGRAGESIAAGDTSGTWRWPATAAVDRFTEALPARVAPVSPLLARVLVDATALRAMLGSPSLLLPACGLVLGGLAAHDVGGHALPPDLPILVAICALGVFDALAGALAAAVLLVDVVVSGGVTTAGDVRVLLGLGGIWFAAPLVAGAARPLRRVPSTTAAERWDRLADFVIASLVGAWLVLKIAVAFPGLAGHRLPIATQGGVLALTVLAALVARMVAESIVATHYPGRLASVHPERIPRSGSRQRVAAALLRTAILVLVAIAFIPPGWQLYCGAALFLLPQLVSIYEDHLPSRRWISAILPRGIVKVVVYLAVGRLLASLLAADIHDPARLVADAFVVLVVPSFVVSMLGTVGRHKPTHPLDWWHRLAGLGVVAAGVVLVLAT